MNTKSRVAIATIITLISILILSIVSNVYATEDILSVTSVDATEKSATVEIEKLSIEGTAVNADIVYHKIGDYAKLKITIKNNGEQDYKIKSITDNNENSYISYEYSDYSGKALKAGETAAFYVTIKYANGVSDISNRLQNLNVDITVTLEDDYGNTVEETISVNPKTGDKIYTYITIFAVSVIALIVFTALSKNGKKSMKIFGLLLVLVLVTPIIVYADGNSITLNFKNKLTLKDKINLTYLNASNEEETKVVDYGTLTSTLNHVEKENYDFVGWFDENDNKVESVTEDVKLTPKYKAEEFKITYTLNGGTADNVTSYTKETATFTLVKPKRTGFIFIGWTGSNGDTPQKDVTITQGTTGDKTYTANWVEGTVEINDEYIHPSDEPYSWFGHNNPGWESSSANLNTYPWSYPTPCLTFEEPITRVRLGYSKAEYVTYNSQDDVAGYIDQATKTKIWLGSGSDGSAVDGYYTVGYTTDGDDHELQVQISSGKVINLQQMY